MLEALFTHRYYGKIRHVMEDRQDIDDRFSGDGQHFFEHNDIRRFLEDGNAQRGSPLTGKRAIAYLNALWNAHDELVIPRLVMIYTAGSRLLKTIQKIIVLVILPGLLVCACSASNKPIQNVSIPIILSHSYKVLDNTYWWQCKFKHVWPAHVRPDLVVDLFPAHAVVSPILAEHIDDIPYWRFHRRAARDQAGHQFSLLFYSKPDVAAAVVAAIQENEILQRAVAAKLVEKVIMDNADNPNFSAIESTSDTHWSLVLQKPLIITKKLTF